MFNVRVPFDDGGMMDVYVCEKGVSGLYLDYVSSNACCIGAQYRSFLMTLRCRV